MSSTTIELQEKILTTTKAVEQKELLGTELQQQLATIQQDVLQKKRENFENDTTSEARQIDIIFETLKDTSATALGIDISQLEQSILPNSTSETANTQTTTSTTPDKREKAQQRVEENPRAAIAGGATLITGIKALRERITGNKEKKNLRGRVKSGIGSAFTAGLARLGFSAWRKSQAPLGRNPDGSAYIPVISEGKKTINYIKKNVFGMDISDDSNDKRSTAEKVAVGAGVVGTAYAVTHPIKTTKAVVTTGAKVVGTTVGTTARVITNNPTINRKLSEAPGMQQINKRRYTTPQQLIEGYREGKITLNQAAQIAHDKASNKRYKRTKSVNQRATFRHGIEEAKHALIEKVYQHPHFKKADYSMLARHADTPARHHLLKNSAKGAGLVESVKLMEQYDVLTKSLLDTTPPRTQANKLLEQLMKRSNMGDAKKMTQLLDLEVFDDIKLSHLDDTQIQKLAKTISTQARHSKDIVSILHKEAYALQRPMLKTGLEKLESVKQRLDRNQQEINRLETYVQQKTAHYEDVIQKVEHNTSYTPAMKQQKKATYQQAIEQLTTTPNKRILTLEHASAQDLLKLDPQQLPSVQSHPLAADIIKHNGEQAGFVKKMKLVKTGKLGQTLNIGIHLLMFGYMGRQSYKEHNDWGDVGLDAADMGIGMIPVAGGIYDLGMAIRGKDLSGDEMSGKERRMRVGMGVIGLIPGVGTVAKLVKGGSTAAKTITKTSTLGKVAKGTKLVLQGSTKGHKIAMYSSLGLILYQGGSALVEASVN